MFDNFSEPVELKYYYDRVFVYGRSLAPPFCECNSLKEITEATLQKLRLQCGYDYNIYTCRGDIFYNCTSLKTLPENLFDYILPHKELYNGKETTTGMLCLRRIFYGCTSLETREFTIKEGQFTSFNSTSSSYNTKIEAISNISDPYIKLNVPTALAEASGITESGYNASYNCIFNLY